MRGPLRCHHAMLGEMAAQRVDQLGTLAHQKIAGPKDHRACLLFFGLHGDKAHCRTRRRLRDRLGVSCIVLLALHKRLHIDRWYQPHLMPELANLPAPAMCRCASLHRHCAARLRRQKRQEMRSRQLLAKHHRSVRCSAMRLKNPLCEIDADDANLFHGCSLLLWRLINHHLGTLRCRREGASTPS